MAQLRDLALTLLHDIYNMSYKDIAETLSLNVDGVRGRVARTKRAMADGVDLNQVAAAFRKQHKLEDKPERYGTPPPLPEELALTGDMIVIGDVHLPTTLHNFAALPLAIAQKHLTPPRQCLIAGDLLNLDSFSAHDIEHPTAGLPVELMAARSFLRDYLTVFDVIYLLPGNHERRISKRTFGSISTDMLFGLIAADDRLRIGGRGYAQVVSGGVHWRVTHPRNYSRQQLKVADELALKYQCNIISWHEHHAAVGHDKYGRYTIVNGGGLFDSARMAYVSLDDSTSAAMTPGFVLLRGGKATLFTEQGTDWSLWL